jgi:hypothetical protein
MWKVKRSARNEKAALKRLFGIRVTIFEMWVGAWVKPQNMLKTSINTN